MTRHVGLFVLLAAYAVLAVLFAVRTPAWQAPDEPAHYNYVRQAAGGVWLPVIELGDWDSAALEQLKAQRFRARHPPTSTQLNTRIISRRSTTGWLPPSTC
jgi:hypothetical protein